MAFACCRERAHCISCTRVASQIVESGAKSIDIGVMLPGQSLKMLSEADIQPIVAALEAEVEAEMKRASADN